MVLYVREDNVDYLRMSWTYQFWPSGSEPHSIGTLPFSTLKYIIIHIHTIFYTSFEFKILWSFGRAVVPPIIKKPSLDCNEFSNYRPVSNINFISKIILKVVAGQLKHYLAENKLIETYQSAYVPSKSTETALLKVQSDILNAVDSWEVVFLVMLDLSVAAFDTIDHGILLHCLQNNFVIAGNFLKWIKSYVELTRFKMMAPSLIHMIWNMEYHMAQSLVPWASSYTLILLEASFANMDSNFTCTLMTPRYMFPSTQDLLEPASQATLRQLEHCITDLSDWRSTIKAQPNRNRIFHC